MKFKKHFQQFKTDPSGLIFKALRLVFVYVKMQLSTIIVRMISFLKRINIGKGSLFFGLPIIDRAPLSNIVIGNNCTFRSDRTTNWSHKKKMVIRTYNEDAEINIGEGVGANGSVIVSAKKIEIGDNVLIGFNCYIADTDSHPVDPITRHTGLPDTSPVKIEDNVWLGANVVVLKGVTIGENSVIGSNSLVLSNIPANVIAIGNPCRVVKKLD